MDAKMIDVTMEFLQGLNDDAESLIETVSTNGQLCDVLRILTNCRNELLDYKFGMLIARNEKEIENGR